MRQVMVVREKDKKKKVAKVVRRDEIGSTLICNIVRHFLMGKRVQITTLKWRSYKFTKKYDRSIINNGYREIRYWRDIACALLIFSLMQMEGMNSVKISRFQTLYKEINTLVSVSVIE